MFNDETQANERMAARKGFEAAVRGFRHVGMLRERDGKVIACSRIIKPIEGEGSEKNYFSADSIASNRAWGEFSAPFVRHYPLQKFAELVQSVKESEASHEAAKSDSLISTVKEMFLKDALSGGPVDQEPVLLDSGHVTMLTSLRSLKSNTRYLTPTENPWTREELKRYAVDPFLFALGSWMRNPDATPFDSRPQGERPFVVWKDITTADSKDFNFTQSTLASGLICAYLAYIFGSVVSSGSEIFRSMAEADSVSSSLRRGGASFGGALQRLLLGTILYVSAFLTIKTSFSNYQRMMGPQTPPSFKELASGSMIASSALHVAGDEVAQPRVTRNEGGRGR